MMIRLDNYFAEALQEEGYDLTFKKLKEIYLKSRQHPLYLHNKRRKERLKEARATQDDSPSRSD